MGIVYLVGAGPGAPDLLTVRALKLLRRAQIVFHDALVDPATVACARKAVKIAVGKRCGRHSTAQRFINKRLIDAAARYEVVVRLKGGDPMLFGRAQEEIDALLQAGVEVRVVPGVTSALAASAELGVSLTRRGVSRSVVFVTPRTGLGENCTQWVRGVMGADTAVIYMAAAQSALVSDALRHAGVAGDVPVVLVENASLPEQRQLRTTLERLANDVAEWGVRGPAAIMLGEVFRPAATEEELASRIEKDVRVVQRRVS